MTLVLASTSPFRKSLLSRLQLPFTTHVPAVDETPYPQEVPYELVKRLAELKARSAQADYPHALVIGSDQVAVREGEIIGKPNTHEQAVKQLQLARGRPIDFVTGLCLFNTHTQNSQVDVIRFTVQFRQLTDKQIENYLRQEKPYNCAGSFKSEGLGIVLIESMLGTDPTALVGLPLIRLVQMLAVEGIQVI